MSWYAIPITEKNLDLLEVLNDGVRPAIEGEPTWYLIETEAYKANEIYNTIETKDTLYSVEGVTKETLVILS